MKTKAVAAALPLLGMLLSVGCVTSRPASLLKSTKTDDVFRLSDEELQKERRSLFKELNRFDRMTSEMGTLWLPATEASTYEHDVLLLDVLRLRLDLHVKARIAELEGEFSKKSSSNRSKGDDGEGFNRLLQE